MSMTNHTVPTQYTIIIVFVFCWFVFGQALLSLFNATFPLLKIFLNDFWHQGHVTCRNCLFTFIYNMWQVTTKGTIMCSFRKFHDFLIIWEYIKKLLSNIKFITFNWCGLKIFNYTNREDRNRHKCLITLKATRSTFIVFFPRK